MRRCASTTFGRRTRPLSAQRDDLLLKHKRAVFVTTRFDVGDLTGREISYGREDPSTGSGRRLAPTLPFSFLSLFRQLRGLRKNRSWRRRCAAGAWTRSWSRLLGCAAATRRARGGYCGGSSSACALDVGALTFSLITCLQFF